MTAHKIKNVLIFGFGYCAQKWSKDLIKAGYLVVGTSRHNKKNHNNATLIDFDNDIDKIEFEIERSNAILICIPPNDDGADLVLARFSEKIIQNKVLSWVGYLSSTGVYGDHQGEWVTETSACKRPLARAKKRIYAEQSWLSLYKQYGIPVHIFRLSGIYGPKRNRLEKVILPNNVSIMKPGHFFSRIHVQDISNILLKSMQNPAAGEIYNIADDYPSPIHEVDSFAANLLNLQPPTFSSIEDASISSMYKSFFSFSRKVSNQKIKKKLNVKLQFPSYKEGLTHINYSQKKTGILLINLGTPDGTSKPEVRRYLREFLSDYRVVDISKIARFFLLNAVILPFRTPKTAHAYKKIWSEDGSPLMVHSQNLLKKLREKRAFGTPIELGMRYGNPSIEKAINNLIAKDVEQIKILPLFPQYASATNGSTIEKIMYLLSKRQAIPAIEIIPPFYRHEKYIEALAESIKPTLEKINPQYLLLSYHGIPERHIKKIENMSCCDMQQKCPAIHQDNKFCYRAQCYETSSLLAQKLDLTQDQYGVSFQSRLGNIPWIKPYSDERLDQLRLQGIENIAIACPAFVADCLETIEEIGITAKKKWMEAGGKTFTLIPCLNDNQFWVTALNNIIDQSQDKY